MAGSSVRRVLLVVAVAGVAVGGWYLLRPTHCDGIPRETGGCDRSLAAYTADTCLGIAEEWGRLVDAKLLAIIGDDGPRIGKGWRTTRAMWTITQRANQRLRDLGLVAVCDADEFFARGHAEFSAELLTLAPQHYSDVLEDEVTYEMWEAEVRQAVDMIDQAEDLPYLSETPTRWAWWPW